MTHVTEQHLILFIEVWILLLIAKIFIQHQQIEVYKSDPHVGRSKVIWWIVNGMASILHGAHIMTIEAWIKYFVIVGFQITSHMVFFGPGLNLSRRKPYFYLGLNSGWFDEFFVVRPRLYKVFYFLCIVGMIYSIHLLNQMFR